jgi:putative Holliday junction resolvase
VKVIGIDLGTRRIGVAISDHTGTLASPLTVIARSGDVSRDHRAIADLVAEEGAARVVVGMPLSLSGKAGPAARAAAAEVEQLSHALDVPVETYDERLTTVTADRSMMERRMKADARRRVVDKVAAAVMLQSWLDRESMR